MGQFMKRKKDHEKEIGCCGVEIVEEKECESEECCDSTDDTKESCC
ncbi:hypothetical protein [Evansella halocellulosilytica]|nr:hypothetical protein [Evansella halocellulosilytica]